jgi:26S proteasome regulatory subunit T2
LKQLRFERIKDYLLLEEEFIKNQERLKPQEDRHEVFNSFSILVHLSFFYRKNVRKLMIFGMKMNLFLFKIVIAFYFSRGSPMAVGTLEEIIDDNHAIVSTSVGSEHYVTIMSFVDKDQLEPGCTVLLNHKVNY